DVETLDSSNDPVTFSISTLTAATHDITAVYSGDNNFNTSTGDVSQTVNPAATRTSVTSTFDGGAATVTFYATVTVVLRGAGTPTGTVLFQEGGAVLDQETPGGTGVVQ